MSRRFTEDLLRESSRDRDRELRVQQRYGNILDEEEQESEEEELEIVKSHSQASIGEDVVEVIAPLLNEKPTPLTSFDDACIPDFVKHVVKVLGFKEPTIIQKYCTLQLFSHSDRHLGMRHDRYRKDWVWEDLLVHHPLFHENQLD